MFNTGYMPKDEKIFIHSIQKTLVNNSCKLTKRYLFYLNSLFELASVWETEVANLTDGLTPTLALKNSNNDTYSTTVHHLLPKLTVNSGKSCQ
jgi:hypothetical protein